jgi:hypothetical protein
MIDLMHLSYLQLIIASTLFGFFSGAGTAIAARLLR